MTSTKKLDIHRDLPDVVRMRNQGQSWRAIGEHYGVSGQRVHQVYSDLEPIHNASSPREYAAHQRADLSRAVTQYLNNYGPLTRDSLLAEFDITPHQLRTLDYPHHLVIEAKAPDTDRHHYSDEDMHAALRAAAKEMGEPLSATKYAEWYSRQPKGSVISLPAIHLRSYWADAVKDAGLQHGTTNRPSYSRRWSRDDILALIAEFVEDCVAEQRAPTYAAYDVWQRKRPDAPSGSTARKMAGTGWTQIILDSAGY